jgi:hypothetical protein
MSRRDRWNSLRQMMDHAQEARGLERCMRDLRLERGYVIYPGNEDYSLGAGIMALGAEKLLSNPSRVAQL